MKLTIPKKGTAVPVKGTAVLGLPDGRKVVIRPSDVNFVVIGSLLEEFGGEVTHEAIWRSNADGTGPGGAWMVWEKPHGIFNDYTFEPIEGATLIADFEFPIELASEE